MEMNKEQFLRSLNDVYCRLGVTAHGVGLVAIRDIPKGTNPLKHCDPFGDQLEVPQAELDASDAPEEAKDVVRDFCVLQNGVFFVPTYGIDAVDKSYFLNHSKDPNVESPDEGQTFYAARDIKKGEELTADYDTYQEFRKEFRK
jgi:hypothetical protein